MSSWHGYPKLVIQMVQQVVFARRCETKSMFFHHSRLPITLAGFLLFSLITCEILLFASFSRSLLLRYSSFCPKHRPHERGHPTGIIILTATLTLFTVTTSCQSCAAKARQNDCLRCSLQSRTSTLRRAGLSFVPAGNTKPS